MKTIDKDIKDNNFKQIYLLTGQEGYLIRQFRKRLADALLGDGDAMNLSYYEGKKTVCREVIDMAETLPFFAERRVIVVENSDWFKKSSEEMAEFLSRLPETTYVVFAEQQVDKRTKLYKTVSKVGYIADFPLQKLPVLKKWIEGKIRREKKEMSPADLDYFIGIAGEDMSSLEQETEKLLCYTLDKQVVTRKDIDAICTPRLTDRVFDMIDAAAMGDENKMLFYYRDLLALKTPAQNILGSLIWNYTLLMNVKELRKQGRSESQMIRALGVKPYPVQKSLRQIGRFTTAELRRSVEEAIMIEERIKTGRMEAALGVELFLVAKARRMEGYLE